MAVLVGQDETAPCAATLWQMETRKGQESPERFGEYDVDHVAVPSHKRQYTLWTII